MTKTKARMQQPLTRQDWVGAARRALIARGIAGLSLRGLAQELGATTGAFYWLYGKLDELLEDVRQDWIVSNTAPFEKAISEAGPDGMTQYLAYVRVLVLEEEFDPRYDNAIRDWAHSCARTAGVLREIELVRIEQLRDVFRALGFAGQAALIRARVTYFSQTGYNAMQIVDPPDERLLNLPYYAEIFVDRTDMLGLDTPEAVRDYIMRHSRPH